MKDKFRVWYPAHQSLSPPTTLKEFVRVFAKHPGAVSNFLDSEVEILWFTGEKSIDGDEVYDGDILVFPNDSANQYEVKWHEGGWSISYKDLPIFKIGMTSFLKVKGSLYDKIDPLH